MTDEDEGRIAQAEQRIAHALARGVTRRSLFQRAARGGLIVGGALSAPLAFFEGSASASFCNTVVDLQYGCVCNPATADCGGSFCTGEGNCQSPLRVRCNGWPGNQNSQGQYCWCSQTCTYGGGVTGHRVCCDCWKGGHSAGCMTAAGDSPCICNHWHPS